MSKTLLARARYKPFDQLPEWVKCCDWMRNAQMKHIAEMGTFVVNVASTCHYPKKECPSCGANLPKIPAVKLVGGKHDGWFAAFESLDIDEGAHA